jgi:hypothetical protein
LGKAGLEVRGLDDSGTLYLLINPGLAGAGFGAKRQMQSLWPGKNVHVPFEWWDFNKPFINQKLTVRAKRHCVQDVLTPYAVLFAAAIKRVKED